MWLMPVVMVHEETEDPLKVRLVQNQQAVETLRAECEHKPLGTPLAWGARNGVLDHRQNWSELNSRKRQRRSPHPGPADPGPPRTDVSAPRPPRTGLGNLALRHQLAVYHRTTRCLSCAINHAAHLTCSRSS